VLTIVTMPRSKTSKNRMARSRNNSQTPMPVVSLTPSQAFERQLAQSNDSTVLRGKALFQFNVGTTPGILLTLTPQNLGVRGLALSTVFSRFRIKAAVFKYSSAGVVTGLTTAIGLVDDATTGSDGPTTLSGVLQLRTSASYLPNQTEPSTFMYRPVDKTKWYYCNAGGTGSDQRLSVPATLYGAAVAAATTIVIEIDFSLVFSGADDIGAT